MVIVLFFQLHENKLFRGMSGELMRKAGMNEPNMKLVIIFF